VKVAQYEVLGNDAKRHGRPVRDDRNARLLVSHAAQRFRHWSIVPFLLRRPDYGGQAGTDSSLKTLTQHCVLGFRQVPAGLIFTNHLCNLIATLKLTRMAKAWVLFPWPFLLRPAVASLWRAVAQRAKVAS
jgi:hypothetical protein